jgi:hypothetical protein
MPVEETEVVDVYDTQKLPKLYIPFSSVEAARKKFPGEQIIRYIGKVPGWQIIAISVTKILAKEEQTQ